MENNQTTHPAPRGRGAVIVAMAALRTILDAIDPKMYTRQLRLSKHSLGKSRWEATNNLAEIVSLTIVKAHMIVIQAQNSR